MIYIQNITTTQEIAIPRSGLTAQSAVFILVSTAERTEIYRKSGISLDSASLYHSVSIILPQGIKDGEYAYYLTANGMTIAQGLLQIGDYERMTSQGSGTMKIKQGK